MEGFDWLWLVIVFYLMWPLLVTLMMLCAITNGEGDRLPGPFWRGVLWSLSWPWVGIKRLWELRTKELRALDRKLSICIACDGTGAIETIEQGWVGSPPERAVERCLTCNGRGRV